MDGVIHIWGAPVLVDDAIDPAVKAEVEWSDGVRLPYTELPEFTTVRVRIPLIDFEDYLERTDPVPLRIWATAAFVKELRERYSE